MKLTSTQYHCLSKIPDGHELLIDGAGWADYYIVEPGQVDGKRLVGVSSPTVEALIKKGMLVQCREVVDRSKMKTLSRGWLRRWYTVKRDGGTR